MRTDVEQITPVEAAPRPYRRPPIKVARERRRIDWFDLAVLAVFSLLSVWVLARDLWQVAFDGRVWTGTDGVYIVDQLQYLAWIREASQHLFISNMFVLHPTAADYFQPAVVVSGALVALGMAPWLALLLWKPVAVAGLFFAVRAYTRRSIKGIWPRRATLVLALFFGSFSVSYGSWGVIGDLMLGFSSWGYTFGLLAVAALVAGLLLYDRARTAGRISLLPGLLGAFAGLIHPWQAEILVLIVVGGRAVGVARRPSPRPPALARADGGDARRRPVFRCSTTSFSGGSTRRGSSRVRPASTRSRCGRSRWRSRRSQFPPRSATAAGRARSWTR